MSIEVDSSDEIAKAAGDLVLNASEQGLSDDHDGEHPNNNDVTTAMKKIYSLENELRNLEASLDTSDDLNRSQIEREIKKIKTDIDVLQSLYINDLGAELNKAPLAKKSGSSVKPKEVSDETMSTPLTATAEELHSFIESSDLKILEDLLRIIERAPDGDIVERNEKIELIQAKIKKLSSSSDEAAPDQDQVFNSDTLATYLNSNDLGSYFKGKLASFYLDALSYARANNFHNLTSSIEALARSNSVDLNSTGVNQGSVTLTAEDFALIPHNELERFLSGNLTTPNEAYRLAFHLQSVNVPSYVALKRLQTVATTTGANYKVLQDIFERRITPTH